MVAVKALGALLLYPGPSLLEALDGILEVVEDEAALHGERVAKLTDLVTHLRQADLLDLQEAYVSLFDTGSAHSLHLFHHLYGDASERGRAMAELLQLYRVNGYEPVSNELPDYLPMFCEFASQLPRSEASTILGTVLPVLELLEQRLTERSSAYASVLAALAAIAEPGEDAPAVAEMLHRQVEAAEVAKTIDEAWAEPIVDFTQPVAPTGSERVVHVAPPEPPASARRGGNR